MSKAIALNTTRALHPHQAPPISIATRRTLFGTMGAMLLLSAAEAGSDKATELDGELLACCAGFHEANRASVAFNYDPDPSDEKSIRLSDNREALLERLIDLPARTPEGLMAKAAALQVAMHTDVPEYLADTFE